MKVVIMTKPTPVIAVGDKIRTIDGHGKMLYQIQLDSKVTCFDLQSEPASSGYPLLIFGLKNGGLGALELTNQEAVVLWESECSLEGKAAVQHLKVAQLQEGVQNIIVTREDGVIEIFTYTQRQEPVLVYEYKEPDEQITGLTYGFITSPKVPEVIYTCYSGAIKSICERKTAKKLGIATEEEIDSQPVMQSKKETSLKISQLETEVAKLQEIKKEEEIKVAPV